MIDVIDRISSTPFGHIAFKAVRPLVHLFRRMAHPGISNDLMVSTAAYRNRKFSILHRRWSNTDLNAIDQCFKQQQYDMPTGAHGTFIDHLYQDILSSGRQPLIVDCGANIGTSVMWFNARYPQAHIVAIEPAPDNFNLLSRNCTGLDVDLRQAGISSQDGRAYISCVGSPMAYRTNTNQKGVEIDMISLSTVLASKSESLYTPFLLKLDIEGAEKELFDLDFAVFNRFPLIIFEPHDWLLPGQLTSQKFFHFHAASGREFCMHNENIASIAPQSTLVTMAQEMKH